MVVNVLKVLCIVMLFCVLGAAVFGATLLAKANNTTKASYQPRSSALAAGTDANKTVEPYKDSFSILIMGIDDNSERKLGSARTDTMILVTVNPTKKKISMVSIPRDSYVKVDTSEFTGYTKINSAYTYGKEDATISTVENLLDVPINFYVTVDFDAFQQIIDALGGVEINVPVAISEANADVTKIIKLEPGLQTLNGEEALAFARTRKIDNDIKRGERQQLVVQAVIKKALKVGSITKYSSVLSSLDDHFWTDMNQDTMLQIAQSGLTNKYTFDSYSFLWTDNGTGSYVYLYQDSLDYISHKLRYSLGLDEADYRDEDGYTLDSSDGVISSKTPTTESYSSDDNSDYSDNSSDGTGSGY